jgi:hypothetical protein
MTKPRNIADRLHDLRDLGKRRDDHSLHETITLPLQEARFKARQLLNGPPGASCVTSWKTGTSYPTAKFNLQSAGCRREISQAGDAEPSHVPARNVVPAPCSASLRSSPPSGCLKRCNLVTVTDAAGAAHLDVRERDTVLPPTREIRGKAIGASGLRSSN